MAVGIATAPAASQTARPRLTPAVVATLACLAQVVAWGGSPATRWGGTLPWAVVVAVTVVAFVPLALLPHRPRIGFMAVWLLGLWGIVVPTYDPNPGLLLALFRIARTENGAVTLPATFATLPPVALLAFNNAASGGLHAGSVDLAAVAFILGLWALVYAAVIGVARRLRSGSDQVNRLAHELAASEEQARRRERARIARELHDTVAHSLSGIALQAAGARAVLRADRAADPVSAALASIEDAAGQGMRELHRLLGLIKGPETDGAEPGQRRWAEVPELIALASGAGLHVTLDEAGTPQPLDPSVEHTAFRVVQECLTNAMKHAGRGGTAQVDVCWGLLARPSQPGGNGLTGLAERVAAVGGTLEAQRFPEPVEGFPEPDEGFRTHARLPLSPPGGPR